MDRDTAVLVCSCDKYDDVWGAFFTLLFRYWPEIPHPVYLLANEKGYDDPRVTTVHTPAKADWSTTFLAALDAIPSRRVLVVMEDYLLQRPVNGARIAELIRIMEREGAACVQVFPDGAPSRRHPSEPGLGIVAKGQPFRVTLQAAVWDRQALRELVRPGENAWDFEVKGSRRSDVMDRPYLAITCAKDDAPFPYYQTGVVRGVWMPGAVRLCRREGIELDLSRRRVGWVRGAVRESRFLYPLRVGFVMAKRLLGVN